MSKIHLKNAKKIVTLLDTEFSLMGIKFGLDPILNIIPGFGSLFGAAVSIYLFWIAYKLNSGLTTYLKMAANILLDFLLGVIPVVGIFFDVAYKSNVRNLKILEKLSANVK